MALHNGLSYNAHFSKLMETICSIGNLDVANAGANINIKVENHDDLNISVIIPNHVSVSHNFIQNGDVMNDPEIMFWVTQSYNPRKLKMETAWIPYSYRNDGVGINREYVTFNDSWDMPKTYNRYMQKDLSSFCNTWQKNIKEQGYVKSLENQMAEQVVESPAPVVQIDMANITLAFIAPDKVEEMSSDEFGLVMNDFFVGEFGDAFKACKSGDKVTIEFSDKWVMIVIELRFGIQVMMSCHQAEAKAHMVEGRLGDIELITKLSNEIAHAGEIVECLNANINRDTTFKSGTSYTFV